MIASKADVIRGIAVPIGKPVYLSAQDITERFLPGAFRDCKMRISLVWGSHYGSVIGHTERVFETSRGLAFEANLSSRYDNARRLIRSRIVQCSIHFCAYRCTSLETHGARVITRAELNHIALVSDPAYDGTGVWMASQESNGRGRTHELAKYRHLVSSWHAGCPKITHWSGMQFG